MWKVLIFHMAISDISIKNFYCRKIFAIVSLVSSTLPKDGFARSLSGLFFAFGLGVVNFRMFSMWHQPK
jgi:hypothetical protein